MFLNDQQIRERITKGDLVIDPRLQDAHDIGPFSIELRLGTQFGEFYLSAASKFFTFDPCKTDFETNFHQFYQTKSVQFGEAIIVHPNKHLIANTLQFLQIPSDLCALIFPRSIWTRVGLTVASSPVDPGFQGRLTISIVNFAEIPIALYPGIRIAEMALMPISPSDIPIYRGKYKPATEPSFSSLYFTQDPDFIRLKQMLQERTNELKADQRSISRLQALYQTVYDAKELEKGKALEEFTVSMFQGIKGIRIIRRNARLKAEEIDLLVANDLTIGFWRHAGSPIIVECKNWSNKVGAREIGVLSDKLISIGPDAKTGILIAPNGVSGTEQRDAVLKTREKRQQGQYIIVLERRDLDEIVQFGNVLDVIQRKYDELVLI